MPFPNKVPSAGPGDEFWAPPEGTGSDDATLNDLLALYQSANDASPPFSSMVAPAAFSTIPSGAEGSSVDAEIDELIRSFQDTPPPFASPPAVPQAPIVPPPPVVIDPIIPASVPLEAVALQTPQAQELPPPAPPPHVVPPPATLPLPEPAPLRPAMPSIPSPSPPIASPIVPPLPQTPQMPTPPVARATAPAGSPAPLVGPTGSGGRSTGGPKDLGAQVAPAMTIPISATPVAAQPIPTEVIVKPFEGFTLPTVSIEAPGDRVALAQHLTEIIANLANGVDHVQSQLDGLYSLLADAAGKRAPVADILKVTQALQQAKGQVGEDSPLYQQAMLLRQVGEAYMHLLRTL